MLKKINNANISLRDYFQILNHEIVYLFNFNFFYNNKKRFSDRFVYEDLYRLECKYNLKSDPLYGKRQKIINRTFEPE